MKALANYIIQKPDELIMQGLTITRAALNTNEVNFRETLLYVLFDKQLALTKASGALGNDDPIS